MARRKKPLIILIILSLFAGSFFIFQKLHSPRRITYHYGTDVLKDSEYLDTDQPELNEDVSDHARGKYLNLKGDGKDKVTALFYIIGNDDAGDATDMISTINNIVYANDSKTLNVILETGGSSCWNSQVLQDGKIQRWKADRDSLSSLDDDVSYTSMCNPDCLKEFLLYSMAQFPADRYELFLIGQGSQNSFGYDPDGTYTSLSYSSIADILSELPSKIDILGLDAPYGSSMENAILFEPYADYMVAFESQVVSTGMLYQSFLSKLADNSSTSSLNLGKLLIDSYTMNSSQKKYTVPYVLSLTDLSEIPYVRDTSMTAFAQDMKDNLNQGIYQTISDVLTSAEKIGSFQQKDCIDLTHFSKRFSTESAQNMYNDLLNCVKYRRTADSPNAYGLSSVFPSSSLQSASSLYSDDYQNFINTFNLYTALARVYVTRTFPSFAIQISSQKFEKTEIKDAEDLLSDPLFSQIFPLSSSFTEEERRTAAEYVTASHISTDHLKPVRKAGSLLIPLDENDLAMVHDIERSVFMKKGPFFIHLGNSRQISYNAQNQPQSDGDGNWYSINDQPIPYTPATSDLNPDIIGYAHALVNGDESYLLISKKSYEASPSIIGYVRVYSNPDISQKDILSISSDDQITFLYETFQSDGTYAGTLPAFQPFHTKSFTLHETAVDSPLLSSIVIQDFYHMSYYTEFQSVSQTGSMQ